MYFSEAFRILDPDQHEWFDPILERDSHVFADPFTIFADTDETWKQAHDTVISYFHDAFETLAKSNLRPSHQFYKRTLILMEFPEPEEFRLGYGRKDADGSGAGPGLARLIVGAMVAAIKHGLEDIRHFEELGILVEGINRDRISDITCNLLKPRLIQYTQEICRSLNIPMHNKMLRHSFYNELRQRWDDSEHLVPVDPVSEKAILLIPKRFLADLPTINEFDFEDTALRDDLNLNISKNVRKADIVRLARRNPEVLREWVSRREEVDPRRYDVGSDPKLFVKWQKVAKGAVEAEPLDSDKSIGSEDDLMVLVHNVIAKFRHWAEDKGGWRIFWSDGTTAIPEPNMQLLFLGVLDGYCERAGIRLDREVETGRGPVDFVFTGDRRARVLVEMKKLTHGEFWNGLHVQTPLYMRGQDVRRAIFLVIRDSDTKPMRARWIKLDQEAARVNSETGLQIEIERIDVWPKGSASKAKSRDAL